jgi:hypothetical protein
VARWTAVAKIGVARVAKAVGSPRLRSVAQAAHPSSFSRYM